jgi:AcrR family transcriptional regulator
MDDKDKRAELAGDDGAQPNKHKVKSERTRQAIMDAAERLFAPHGITGASMREIARAADADLSLLAYHFDSKSALYRAVMDRIITDFAQRRMELLDQLEAETDQPTASDLIGVQIEAWLEVGFELPAHRARLILNRFFRSEEEERDRAPSDLFVRRFLAALEKATPNMTKQYVHWAYHGLMGCLIYYLSSRDRIGRLSSEHCDAHSRDAVREAMYQQVSNAFGSIIPAPHAGKRP